MKVGSIGQTLKNTQIKIWRPNQNKKGRSESFFWETQSLKDGLLRVRTSSITNLILIEE